MPQEFSYSHDTRPLTNHTLGWSLILAFEGTVIVTLAVILVPWLWLKLLLPLIALTSLVLFIRRARSPLTTTHLLDETHLTLRFGTAVFSIPRDSVVDAIAVSDRSVPAFSPTLTRLSESRAQLTMSHSGQVLLTLSPPYRSTTRRARGEFSEILISIDEPERLLELLRSEKKQQAEQPHDPAFRLQPTHPRSDIRMIEAIELTKRFNDCLIVDHLSLTVHAGEIYGFIGRNGAGKSTTINILVGLLTADAGVSRINGQTLEMNPAKYKSSLGYVADTPPLFAKLTGGEHLWYAAKMHRIETSVARQRIDTLVEQLELRQHIDDHTEAYSLGTKRKLALAIALLHKPRVLILDEPFNGLDPHTSRNLQRLIIEFTAAGGSVLLSSHDLNLIARLCHRVGLLDGGKLVAEGAPEIVQADATSLEERFLELTVLP
ncbi:MAG: ABC transporter ATP-binding protein [Thermomicrobiales bacterium]|nr:ABC transporter ATP-binding protein [Thermomicrobiales bacterium]